jgi:hypothetical protein
MGGGCGRGRGLLVDDVTAARRGRGFFNSIDRRIIKA